MNLREAGLFSPGFLRNITNCGKNIKYATIIDRMKPILKSDSILFQILIINKHVVDYHNLFVNRVEGSSAAQIFLSINVVN